MLRRRDACMEPGFRPRGLRAGQLNPNQLGGCRLWLTAQLGVTLGTGVSRWADQSGAANHMVQATTARQPLFSNADSEFGNMPALEFSPAAPPNGSQRLDQANNGFVVNQPLTMAFVYQLDTVKVAADGLCRIKCWGDNDYSAGCIIGSRGDAGGTTEEVTLAAGAAAYGGVLRALNVARSVFALFNNAQSHAYVDGAHDINGGTAGTRPQYFLCVGDNDAVDQEKSYYDGKIAEVALWDRLLSAGEMAQLRNTWAAKYGVA